MMQYGENHSASLTPCAGNHQPVAVLLPTNLRLFSRRLQHPVPFGVDLRVTPGEHVLRGDVANRPTIKAAHGKAAPPYPSRRAAGFAKYVRMMLAPARVIDVNVSIMARSSSIQPLRAAATIMEYSPLTW